MMATPEIDELMEKANESLAAAGLLLDQVYADFAVSRAYYAMFYAAEAALLSLGLTFSKHTAVIAAFGKHLAKPGLVPQHLHRYLLDAFDIRQIGDYDAPGMVGEERAGRVLAQTREFIDAVKVFLEAKTPYTGSNNS
jgi:uncharacterized protein (UPF0332 family)